MQAQITASIGEHTVSTVNEGISSKVDLDLADLQRQQSQKLTDLNDSLQTKQKDLDELEEPEKEDSSKVAALKSAIKFGLVGGFGGAFIVAVCCLLLCSLWEIRFTPKELRNGTK